MPDTDWLGLPSTIAPGTTFFSPELNTQTYGLPALPPEIQAALDEANKGKLLNSADYTHKLGELQMQNRAMAAGAQALPEIAQLDPNADDYPQQLHAAVAKNPYALGDARVQRILSIQNQAYNEKRQWAVAQQQEARLNNQLNADVIKDIHSDPEMAEVFYNAREQHGPDAALFAVRIAQRDRGLKDELRANGWTPQKAPLENFMVPGRNYLSHDAVKDWIVQNGVQTKPPTSTEQRAMENESTKIQLDILKAMHDPTQLVAMKPEDRAAYVDTLQQHLEKVKSMGARGKEDNIGAFIKSATQTTAPAKKNSLDKY